MRTRRRQNAQWDAPRLDSCPLKGYYRPVRASHERMRGIRPGEKAYSAVGRAAKEDLGRVLWACDEGCVRDSRARSPQRCT